MGSERTRRKRLRAERILSWLSNTTAGRSGLPAFYVPARGLLYALLSERAIDPKGFNYLSLSLREFRAPGRSAFYTIGGTGWRRLI